MAKNRDKDQYSADSDSLPVSEIDPASGDEAPIVSSKLAAPPQGQQPPLKTPDAPEEAGKSYTDHPKLVYGDVSGADEDSTHTVEKEVVIKPRITATFCVGQTWHSIVKGVKVKVPAEVARILEERDYC